MTDANDLARNEGVEALRDRLDNAKSNGAGKGNSADILPHEALPPEFSEDAIALQFARRHENDLRYVAQWNKWLRWDGTRWQFDDTLLAFDLARRTCRDTAVKCSEKDHIKRAIANAKTVGAVVQLARADRVLAATTEQWDANPWLLNTPGGVIDLRTGGKRPHRLDDYLTKLTAVTPEGECRVWMRFLDRITGGDNELIGFLQRVCGYSLTGSTRDEAMFFGYGSGANGKGTFVNTVSGILSDYHCSAPLETFTLSAVDRHPTELADLRGARLVTATETEEGRRWAESRIKMLTGGDRVKARFMRQDFFEYVPQFKLFITGNHKPSLRSVDEAIRRRLNLSPFTVTIPPSERDPTLKDKLRSEWPGILAWMINGCLDWQKRGLAPPAAVLDATEAYLDEEDAIGAWISERCEVRPDVWDKSEELYKSWRGWAEANNEPAGTQKSLTQALDRRPGLERLRKNKGRGIRGLRVLGDP